MRKIPLTDVTLYSSLSEEQQGIFNGVGLNLHLLTASDIVVANTATCLLPELKEGMNHR